MKQVNQIGVDVDSEELVCSMESAGQRLPLARFANSAAGHKKFIRWVTKGGRRARVCLEATGIYSLEFALALDRAKDVEVMVVNPRAIKDFARACMQRAKTDAVDAGAILEFLQRMPFAAWQPPASEILELQAINRRLDQLHTELTREKNRRHASEFAGPSANAIAHDIEVNITSRSSGPVSGRRPTAPAGAGRLAWFVRRQKRETGVRLTAYRAITVTGFVSQCIG